MYTRTSRNTAKTGSAPSPDLQSHLTPARAPIGAKGPELSRRSWGLFGYTCRGSERTASTLAETSQERAECLAKIADRLAAFLLGASIFRKMQAQEAFQLVVDFGIGFEGIFCLHIENCGYVFRDDAPT